MNLCHVWLVKRKYQAFLLLSYMTCISGNHVADKRKFLFMETFQLLKEGIIDLET